MTNNKKISVIYIVTIVACIVALSVIPMVVSAQSNVFTDPTQTVTITLEEDSTATIPTGAQVAVSNVPEDQLTEQNYADIAIALYGAPSLLAYYDISLTDQGTPVELGGLVMVTLTVPADITNYERVHVISINSDGTILNYISGINADGTVFYYTDTISKCLVIGIGEGVNDGLSTVAILALIVGGAVVISIAGLAFSWFVIHKKTWDDLLALLKKKK